MKRRRWLGRASIDTHISDDGLVENRASRLWLVGGGRTDIAQGAARAERVVFGAALLAVQLDEGVVVVEHGCGPGGGSHLHDAGFGFAGGCRFVDEAEALDDAEVVAVDAHGTATESGEVDDGGASLDADSVEGFEPFADLFGAVAGQEAKVERVAAGGDADERGFEMDGFGLGEGDGTDGVLDLGDGGVAEVFPCAEALA